MAPGVRLVLGIAAAGTGIWLAHRLWHAGGLV